MGAESRIFYIKKTDTVAYGLVSVMVRAHKRRETTFSLFEKTVEHPYSIPFFFSKSKRIQADDKKFAEFSASKGIDGVAKLKDMESYIQAHLIEHKDMLV